jgi:predicted metalloendopeptidase
MHAAGGGPGQFRANGTMLNEPAFCEAVSVKQGSKRVQDRDVQHGEGFSIDVPCSYPTG